MAKLREGEKRVQLCFIRPEDVKLYEFLCREAYRCRWDVQTFCLASLTEAFKEKMEEYEVESIAAEAAQKVRERNNMFELTNAEAEKISLPGKTLPAGKYENGFTASDLVEPPKHAVVSMEDAAKQAEAQIAQLDAVASTMMAKRKLRSSKVPPMPTK